MPKVRLPKQSDPPYLLEAVEGFWGDMDELAGELVKAEIMALLEEAENSSEFLEDLLHDFYGEGGAEDKIFCKFGVKRILFFERENPPRDVWRFRIWRLENLGFQFRIFYTYFPKYRIFVLLGLSERTDDTYDPNSRHAGRMRHDYDELGEEYA